MVLNSSLAVTVADISANLCQYIACNPERLPGDQVLQLLFVFPLTHLGRLAMSLWDYLCYNPNNPSYLSDADDDSDSDNRHSHSD